MSTFNEDLFQSLQTGFIDLIIHSKKEYLPQLLINDKKSGVKFLTTLDYELNSCDEFWFSVAFATASGIATIMNTLIELEEKGIKGRVLVSSYLNFTQPEALKRLLLFKNIELKIVENRDFHSKGYLFKNGQLYDLIIGSSNLTAGALSTNVEWNLKVSATPKSHIIGSALYEFNREFIKATEVDSKFIKKYEITYLNQKNFNKQINEEAGIEDEREVIPNSMQVEALENISQIRVNGKNKALLISATGTGKTYLSAFDAKRFNPKKLLFVVHRLNIALAALKTFKKVFGSSKTMGLYSGNTRDLEKEFIFSTIQTISKDQNLKQFDRDHFEYIVIDESHRAGAESYQNILNHFEPKFLLGMTATPERMDGFDIFELYDHTIAYEIRLHRALDEDMLCPFHYYGVTEIIVDGKTLDDNSDFKLLVSKERISRVIEKAKLYGTDNGKIRGLIFCSTVDECKELSIGFNNLGYKTISLTGESTEQERIDAINRLESDLEFERLDYIFTRDIFNEGIDIPRVNQIIMLRPTQSAIVFVQQLGRGLRKADDKEYLTVIDFIGNYSNNFLVPIALFGDTSFNKDTLRKCMAAGSSILPGTSTINFDKISRAKIFEAINSANMQMKKDLVKDYNLLKYKLGRIPMMVDFIEHGARDAQLYVNYSKSYYNFVETQEEIFKSKLETKEKKILQLLSSEVNNSKRVEESKILQLLLEKDHITFDEIKNSIQEEYSFIVTDQTIKSCISNINFDFFRENFKGKLIPAREVYDINIIQVNNNIISFHLDFTKALVNPTFYLFFKDNINYSILSYNKLFDQNKFYKGFVYYRKYSRKDVFRILNWSHNPLAQNVGGYMLSSDSSNCPIFVNYHKADNISSSTKYEDEFLNNSEFNWMSKSNRTKKSSDVKAIMNYKNGLRLPLFIKKSNDEGSEFYYMGDVTPIDDSFEEKKMMNDKKKMVPVVKMRFILDRPVEETLYNYITRF